jgi:moderate conductance mechanosensitive channel
MPVAAMADIPPEALTDVLPFRPACADDPGTWCSTVFSWTNNDLLARAADSVISSGLQILLIVVIAGALRYLAHRLISRIVDSATSTRARIVGRLPRNGAPSTESPRAVQRAKTIGSVLRSIASIVIFTVAAIMILAEFGVNLAPILASAGIVGVAVGFGAQNLVRDFLSGMFMLLEDQYGVGDVVDLGEAGGTVESVGLRITTLRDLNGTVWYVRNGEIQRVGNKSQGYAVAVVDIPVAHTADVTEATELAGRVARERVSQKDLADTVLADVDVLGLEKISTEGLTLRLLVKVKPGQQWAVQRALNAAITDAFDTANVPHPAVFGPLPVTPAS